MMIPRWLTYALIWGAGISFALAMAATAEPQGVIMPYKDWNAMVERLGCAKEDYAVSGESASIATLRVGACVANRFARLEARVKALEVPHRSK